MKNKKAEVDPIKIIMIFVILAVVVAILIYYFNTQIGKSKEITEKQFDALGDEDGDNIANFIDKCPDVKSPMGKPEFDGCADQAALDAAEKAGTE
ncbi:hypothetical protein JXB27_00860 [Candidatus Woesearchaeota archaeon]|nr:hypothetical protein [Candidatus Woesearchaeota archaeon]